MPFSDVAKKMVLDENTEYTDIKVMVHDEKEHIPCHRAIVCLYSAVIKKAMQSSFKEGQTGEFKFTEECATVDIVRQFLLAMYNPWDLEMDKYAHEIYHLAWVYQSPKVLEMASVALGNMLTVDNFWKTATVSNGHTCPELTKQCRQFLSNQRKPEIDQLFTDTNKNYVAATELYPSLVMPFSVDALRRYKAWPLKATERPKLTTEGYCANPDSHHRHLFCAERYISICGSCMRDTCTKNEFVAGYDKRYHLF